MNAAGKLQSPIAIRELVDKTYWDRLPGIEARTIGSLDAIVSDITHDSRHVGQGTLFCCLHGDNMDGHSFAQQAVDAGACAVLVDHELQIDVDQIIVSDTRQAMGELSAALYGFPSRQMCVVGITGTNGKTTTAHLLAAILQEHGWETQVFGTLSGPRTTPESCDLQRDLYSSLMAGKRAVVMEVTSHAMSMQRAVGTHFEAAVFSNLSPEHLDFHGTLENYFGAKASLFAHEFTDLGIVNQDDAHGRMLIDAAAINYVGFGTDDISDLNIETDRHSYMWRGNNIQVGLGGRFNVANSLCAATVALSIGVGESSIVRGLASAQRVAGRYQVLDTDTPFTVIVDYAHTPDALDRVLQTTRELIKSGGRIILVFGCGGDRDIQKRPMMGWVAGQRADVVIVTSDNPRSEEPLDIAQQITHGIAPADKHTLMVVELDRRSAIRLALMEAKKGDIVIIAGKGHERTQTIGNKTIDFSDIHVALEIVGEIS